MKFFRFFFGFWAEKVFQLLAKKQWKVYQNCILRVQRKNLSKKTVLIFFGFAARNYSKKLSRECQIAFYWSRENFSWKTCIDFFSDYDWNHPIYVWKFSERLWEMDFACPEEIFETVISMKIFLWNSFKFDRKISRIPAEKLRQDCQNCFVPLQMNNLRKNLEPFKLFLGFSVETTATGYFSGSSLPQLYSTCPAESFKKFFSVRKIYFCSFSYFDRKIFHFPPKFLHCCFQTAFFVFTRNFCRRITSELILNFFDNVFLKDSFTFLPVLAIFFCTFSTKIFTQGCQNCVLNVPKNFLVYISFRNLFSFFPTIFFY